MINIIHIIIYSIVIFNKTAVFRAYRKLGVLKIYHRFLTSHLVAETDFAYQLFSY